MEFKHLCCAVYRGSLDNASHYVVVWMQCFWASPCSILSFFSPWCLSFSSSLTLFWSSLHVQTLCLSWELPGGSGCVCTAARSWLPLECLPQSLVFLGDSTWVFFFCIALLMNSAACRCEIGSCDLWAQSTRVVTLWPPKVTVSAGGSCSGL